MHSVMSSTRLMAARMCSRNRVSSLVLRCFSASTVKNVSPKELDSAKFLIDVREPAEYQKEHVKGSCNIPLSSIRAGSKVLCDPSTPIYVLCQRGMRAKAAAEMLNQQGFSDLRVVEGGVNGISDVSLLQTSSGGGSVWEIERQVRFTAGLISALGCAGAVVSGPAWIAVPAFIGCGLVYSAVSNTCGMAAVLMKMPWNRPKK